MWFRHFSISVPVGLTLNRHLYSSLGRKVFFPHPIMQRCIPPRNQMLFNTLTARYKISCTELRGFKENAGGERIKHGSRRFYDKMVWTKRYTDKMLLDKMVWIKY